MTSLTKDQMKAAHFKRQVDLDANLTERDEDRAREWAREMGVASVEDYAARYQAGASVLKAYSLTYSARYTAAPPQVPADVVAYVAVDSGHIATSPAYRLAMFRQRR